MRTISTLLALLLALTIPATPSTAAELTDLALRRNGQLLRLVAGPHGELFPSDASVAPENAVLALEIHGADAEVGLLKVPGTEDAAVESTPSLVYDERLDTAILLWQKATAEDRFHVEFATLRADSSGVVWSEIFRLQRDGAPVALTTPPRILHTEDDLTLDLDDGQSLGTRQGTLHIFWHGDESFSYAGLNFLQGVYTGSHQVLDLSEYFLAAPEGEASSGELSPALGGLLDVRLGSDTSTLLVTFAHPTSGRLGTLAARAMPLRLSALADSVWEEVLLAADLYDPDDLDAFSDKVGASIVIIGAHFHLHPAIVDYLGRHMDLWIQENGADYGFENFPALVDDARHLALNLTSSVYSSTATDPFNPGSTIVEIFLGDFLDELEGTPSSQVLDVEERSNLPWPELSVAPSVHSSNDGQSLLLAFPDNEGLGLHYLESREGGPWSELRFLPFGDRLDEGRARALLSAKIR